MDNEYQFYDFSDRHLASNPIRLQYLNRISENDLSEYQRNGIDLADESDIIREEHLNDQLLIKQSAGGCCRSFNTQKLAAKSSNEKFVFYNPKYERKTHHYEQFDSKNFEKPSFAHRLNGHSNLIAHLTNHIANNSPSDPNYSQNNGQNYGQNYNQNYGPNYGPPMNGDRLDSSGCDLKFLNCNCTKMNSGEESATNPLNPLLSKTKPPTGRTAAASSSNKHRLEIVDTKL